VGQILLAQRLRKKRIIAETGLGSTAWPRATCAPCSGCPARSTWAPSTWTPIAQRVSHAVLGAKVHSVKNGTATLKDAMNEAMRDWVTNVETTHYVLGTVAGPHPYPTMVGELQSVIGPRSARPDPGCHRSAARRMPGFAWAAGPTPWGLFRGFIDDPGVQLFGVEAAGEGVDTNHHAATLGKAGRRAARHAFLRAVRRRRPDCRSPLHLGWPRLPRRRTRAQLSARHGASRVPGGHGPGGPDACRRLARCEGIIPALESAHAVAGLPRVAERLPASASVIINISGRGRQEWGNLQATSARGFRHDNCASTSRIAAAFAKARLAGPQGAGPVPDGCDPRFRHQSPPSAGRRASRSYVLETRRGRGATLG